MTLLMALSRVFAGVHCPHEVAAELLTGGSVAPPVTVLLSRPTRSLARTVRDSRASLAVRHIRPGDGRPGPVPHSTGR
ncbi:hypothetical protein ACNPQM_10175 [Streptomyces sp. NPDC056231]|uniref:hypothetical protein n=1 Tax=Streptomyces sp. NPDC056231 TaxID=3345755 RepID=UPI003AAA9DCA